MWPFNNEKIETFKFITSRQILPQYLRDKFTFLANDNLQSPEDTVQISSLADNIDFENRVTQPILTGREFVFLKKERENREQESRKETVYQI